MIVRHLLALILLAGQALADPAPPIDTPEIRIIDFGLYCRAPITDTVAEPGVALGYITITSATPTYIYRQQQVPAAIGTSFGLRTQTSVPLEEVELRLYRPDDPKYDSYIRSYDAEQQASRGFTFEFTEELITGIWRLEAHHQGKRLYSIEFDVLPPSALPGLEGYCMAIS